MNNGWKKYIILFFCFLAVLFINVKINVIAGEGSNVSSFGSLKDFVRTVVVVIIACLIYNFVKNSRK